MTATAILAPSACRQLTFDCVYGATSAFACAWALRSTCGAATTAAPSAAVCFSIRRRPCAVGFVVRCFIALLLVVCRNAGQRTAAQRNAGQRCISDAALSKMRKYIYDPHFAAP